MAVGAIPAQATETGATSPPRRFQVRVRLRMLLVAAIVSALTSVGGTEWLRGERAAAAGYDAARVQVDAAIARAATQGYSADDLSPVAAALAADRGVAVPIVFQQTGFYDRRRGTMLGLITGLPAVESQAMARRRAAAASKLSDAGSAIETARAQGADPEQLDPVKVRFDKLDPAVAAAPTPKEIDALLSEAALVIKDASAAGAAATAEQAQLAQAADALKVQYAGNIDRIRAAGNGAIAPARNDGTVATLLKIQGTASLGSRLEHYGSLLPGSGLNQVALAAAGAQAYQKRIHDLLLSKMPAQTIALSLSAQELWAYQDGKVVQDTLITSGRPALPTDVGAMKVLSKQSPWKMHSPWPRWSPYWYPDTLVQKVVWFTVTGEGLHDASWEPASLYGPGGQFTSSASHGCVHVQYGAESFLYDWARVGTPVIVHPGDGSPIADQMKQVSVDDSGVPFTGPKGA